MTTAGMAQTAGPQAPATHPQRPRPQLRRLPRPFRQRSPLFELEEVAAATNEGQKAVAGDSEEIRSRKRTELDALKTEIDSLTKQLQNPPATMSDEEKAARARTSTPNRSNCSATPTMRRRRTLRRCRTRLARSAAKLGPVVMKYVQQNGYTVLLNNTGQAQQGGLSIAVGSGNDISAAVVDAYNVSPGVAAPAVAARPRPAAPKPAAPKPAAPKQ